MTVSDHEGADLRVSDAEREQTVAALREHVASGRLTFDEFNDRVGAAYAARTASDLRRLLADLQVPAPAPVTVPAPEREHSHRLPWAVRHFLFINGLLIAIWAASGAGYFWPIWVIIPTGAIMLMRVTGENRPRNRAEAIRMRHERRSERIRERHEYRHDHRHDHRPPIQRTGGDAVRARVVMSILFVDIVGSTQRASALGDAGWRRVVEDYEQGVRREIQRHNGETLFTKGDEIVAGFATPAAAVETGLAIRAHANSLGLQVRAGVHAGEVDKVGNQANGIAMHIGRRVCEAAQPDQVLVSSTVRDLLSGSELRFAPAGERELKGLDGTWRLYEPVH